MKKTSKTIVTFANSFFIFFVGMLFVANASADTVFTASQTIDPWPDETKPSSDLETLNLFFDVPTIATGDALLTLDVVGDFNSVDEFLDVDAETFSLGRLFDGQDGNDLFDLIGDDPGNTILSPPGITVSATIPLASLNNLIADGVFGLTLVPTEAQQPPQGVPASLTATISFKTIPEPSSVLMLLILVTGVGLLGRRN